MRFFIYKHNLDCRIDVHMIDFGEHLQYSSVEGNPFVRKLSDNALLSSIDTEGTDILYLNYMMYCLILHACSSRF